MLASVLASGAIGYVEQRSNVVGDEWLLMLDSREGDTLVVRTYTAHIAGGGLQLTYDAWYTADPQNIKQHKPSPPLGHETDWNPHYPDFPDIRSDPPFRTIHAGGVRFIGLRGARGSDADGRVTNLLLVLPLSLVR